MLGHTYADEVCSAARALEVVGERWSLLIVRDALFAGVTRFSDFARRLGLARNVLADRLDGFVAAGLMERTAAGDTAYQEYRLTEKGRDLAPVILALTEWGDRWAAPDGRPIIYRHRGCGGEIRQQLVCDECGLAVDNDSVIAERGPGMPVGFKRG